MQLTTFVVNRWQDRIRWKQMQRHLDQFPGLEVWRWPAIDAGTVADTKLWRNKEIRDAKKRVAIIRSYRTLFDYLAEQTAGPGPWLILQDDVRLITHPHRQDTNPIHLLGGYHSNKYPTDPDKSGHVHPYAFIATRDAVLPMARLLRNEHDQLCVTWTGYLDTDTVSWDETPTAYALPKETA